MTTRSKISITSTIIALSVEVEAREAIASLYTQRLSNHFSGERVIQAGVPFPSSEWVNLARRFPPYRGIIRTMGKAINEAEFMRDHDPFPNTETYRSSFFSPQAGIEPYGSYFLADILDYRVKLAQREMKTVHIPQEAHALLIEYGNPYGLLTTRNGLEGFSLSLHRAVTQVLAGEIKLSPQTVRI